VPPALFGVSSLAAYELRCWSLGQRQSSSRPIGSGRWGFDHFHWNFIFGFYYIAVPVAAATSNNPGTVRVATLPRPLLMVQVCDQLALAHLAYPCRVSSMPRGHAPLHPALFTIVEDIVAVDGMQATAWRTAFNERFETTPTLQSLLARLS
jgi:hypothetical protein